MVKFTIKPIKEYFASKEKEGKKLPSVAIVNEMLKKHQEGESLENIVNSYKSK